MDSRETPDWCISERCEPQFASPRACYFTAEVVHPRLATAAVYVAVSLFLNPMGWSHATPRGLPHGRFSLTLRGSFCESPCVLLGCLGRTAKVGKGRLFRCSRSESLVLARKASRMRLQRWLCTRLFSWSVRGSGCESLVLSTWPFESLNLRLTRTK